MLLPSKTKKLFARVKLFTSSRKCSREMVSQQLSIISMQCNTDNRAIVHITIRDIDKTPTPMEVKDENQPCVLKTETHTVGRNVGGVKVINIHKLKVPQRMKYTITKSKRSLQCSCRNRNLSVVEEEDNSINSAFLDTISDDDKGVWNTDLFMNGKKVTFKIDTGAEVTAISK